MSVKRRDDAVDLRRVCANEAFKLIPPSGVIGLGGGTTIRYLVELLKGTSFDIKVVTPSLETKRLCEEAGLVVLETMDVNHVDIAFDGCDEVDENFYALKSGGGIHTLEKLVAQMATDYVLLVDESKYVPNLTMKHPITLEVLKEAMSYVKEQVEILGGHATYRKSDGTGEWTVTEHGNYLLDVMFKELENPLAMNHQLNKMAGVLETSLFTSEVTKVLVTSEIESKLLSREELI